MSHATFHVGDTRDVTATLDDDSIDLVLTSPPFLALRSYLPADHPDKGREIGSEATPADFLDVLLELAAEWRRVLAPHGSIAVELGDTYSGGNTGTNKAHDRPQDGGYHISERVKRPGHPSGIRNMDDKIQGSGEGWPLAKSLTLIPELFRIALVYGINPLTGQPSPAGQWRARNVVRWVRPNPPVGALGDKYRPATSEMVVACVSDKRWFDLDAVRGEISEWTKSYADGYPASTVEKAERLYKNKTAGATSAFLGGKGVKQQGAPPLDWWNIPTHPYKGAHYACWPPELCRIPIESMCPRQVCLECGQPRRRITETTNLVDGKEAPGTNPSNYGDPRTDGRYERTGGTYATKVETLGWSDCNHGDNWRPGIVLDPFAGSGTTLAVATGHGRDAIGIDLDHRNLDLARERVGMFLTEAPQD